MFNKQKSKNKLNKNLKHTNLIIVKNILEKLQIIKIN